MSPSFISRRDLVVGATAALAPAATRAAPVPQVAILGDSITAGWGLPAHHALPWRLQDELAGMGMPVRILPSGVIGETTAGGALRVDAAVPPGVELCVVALGGNDFLHAADPTQIQSNLEHIVRRLKAREVTAVLAGVQVPAVLDGEYGRAFNNAFAAAAGRHDVIFLPDLLDGVVLNPDLNQSDGVHPNAAGVAVIARRLAPLVAQGLNSR
jgi:acyl-CoA thioesterase-1